MGESAVLSRGRCLFGNKAWVNTQKGDDQKHMVTLDRYQTQFQNFPQQQQSGNHYAAICGQNGRQNVPEICMLSDLLFTAFYVVR